MDVEEVPIAMFLRLGQTRISVQANEAVALGPNIEGPRKEPYKIGPRTGT